jgi:hypothetical protein
MEQATNKALQIPTSARYIFYFLRHKRQASMQKLHHGTKAVLRHLAEFVCSHQKFVLALG